MSDIKANDGNAVRREADTPAPQCGEPWTYFKDDGVEGIKDSRGQTVLCTSSNSILGRNDVIFDEFNIERCVDEHNAMANIPDPQAFVREVRELMEQWLDTDFGRDAISPLILATEDLLARLDAGRESE